MESVDETKGLKPVPAAAVAEGQEGYGCDIFVRILKNTRWVSKPWTIWQIVVLAFLYGIENAWEFFFTWQFSRLAGLRYCLATHVCWVDLSCKPPIKLPTLRFVTWLAGFYRSIQRSGISYIYIDPSKWRMLRIFSVAPELLIAPHLLRILWYLQLLTHW